MPTLGPTPLIPVNSLKQFNSPWVRNPKRSSASSRTFKWVYRVAFSPSRGRFRRVFIEVKHLNATPPHIDHRQSRLRMSNPSCQTVKHGFLTLLVHRALSKAFFLPDPSNHFSRLSCLFQHLEAPTFLALCPFHPQANGVSSELSPTLALCLSFQI